MEIAREFPISYTVEDYKIWEGDWELIDGIPYAMAPSPIWKHQRISGLLFKQIEEQLEDCPKGCYVCQEIDWIIDERTVVRPNLIVVCGEVELEDHLKKTPDVVFEIVSKTTSFKDEKVKFSLYEKEKVKFYALVYPDIKKMRVFELKNGKFEKIFDSDSGSFTFEIDCPFKVDISTVWKRI
ncbi:MAG: Uma2 family endonuclease [Desulfurobacteriaceae bacterium]